MAKEQEIRISEPEKTSRSPSGTFTRSGYPTEVTSRSIGTVLAYLYDAGAQVPTVFIDDDTQKLTAVYEDTGLSLEFVIVEQALRIKSKIGKNNVFIAPSLTDAMQFLCELEGHRQGTCTPLMKHPNRYLAKSGSDAPRGKSKQDQAVTG